MNFSTKLILYGPTVIFTIILSYILLLYQFIIIIVDVTGPIDTDGDGIPDNVSCFKAE